MNDELILVRMLVIEIYQGQRLRGQRASRISAANDRAATARRARKACLGGRSCNGDVDLRTAEARSSAAG